MRSVIFVVTVTLVPTIIHGASILFYIGGLAHHHHILPLEPFADKLIARGHNVTLFTALKSAIKTSQNVTHFFLEDVAEASESFRNDFARSALRARFKSKYRADTGRANEVFEAGVTLCEATMKSPEFQRWVNVSHFDMVIVDKSSFAECAYAMAFKFGSKIISYSATAGILPWDLGLYGVPAEASWIPSYEVFYDSKHMGFFPRLFTELSAILWNIAYLTILPKHDRVARQSLDLPNMPPLEQVIRSESHDIHSSHKSLILANVHYSDNYAKSLPPFILPVGGMHVVKSRKSLSNNTDAFIRNAGDEGFLYVDFFNDITTTEMPNSLVKVFLEAFQTLKTRVIWKWNGKEPKVVPQNILLTSSCSFHDVLAHPKIRGLITHGDHVIMQTAISYGVPVVLFPVIGDQDYNSKRVRRAGNGLELEFFDLTAARLAAAITKLFKDSSYSKMAKILQQATTVRENSPVDTAVWWAEFVLEQEKAVLDLLKPLAASQPWWMIRLLDVWAFILILSSFTIVVAMISIHRIFILLKKTSRGKTKAE